MSALLLRRLQRLLISSRQAEGLTFSGRPFQQQLATWSERVKTGSATKVCGVFVGLVD